MLGPSEVFPLADRPSNGGPFVTATVVALLPSNQSGLWDAIVAALRSSVDPTIVIERADLPTDDSPFPRSIRDADLVLHALASPASTDRLIAELDAHHVAHLALVDRVALPQTGVDAIGIPFSAAEFAGRVKDRVELARLKRSANRSAWAESRDGFLVHLDDAVRPLIDPNEIVAISARLLGEHLQVDRCAYAEIEADQDTMNLTGNYRRHEGIASIVGRLTFASFGDEVLGLMRGDHPYVVDDIDTHQPPVHDRAAYRATQIQAVICVPLHKNNRFVAAMAVHSATPRHWSPGEVELVLSVANRCWESIERARLTRDLLDSERRLGLAQRAGKIGVFEWFIPEDRVIWSPELEAIYGLPPGGFTGGFSAWAARVEPADAAKVNEQVQAALAATASSISYEFRARIGQTLGENAPQRWFVGQADFTYDAAGRPLRMIGVNIDVDDRKRAAEALDEARRRLEATLRAVEVGTFTYDARTDRASVDRNIAQMFGFPDAGELTGSGSPDFHERIHPEDRDRHVAAMGAALTDPAADTFTSEFRVVRPTDGSTRWLVVRAAITREPTTRAEIRKDGVALDVTARRGAEVMLRASEERYRSLVQATSQVVWTADADGDLTADSITWGDFTGQMPAQFARRGWQAAVHPDDRDTVAHAWELSIDSREPIEIEFRLRRALDDTFRRVVLRGVAIVRPDGTAKEWVGTVTDVEEQRRATDALAQSEARFRQLADSLPMLAWTARPDGRRDWFNRRWEEFTGLTTEQLLNEAERFAVYEPSGLEEAVRRWHVSVASGQPYAAEFAIRRHDGVYRHFQIRAEPLREPTTGRILQWIGICTDVEQQRQSLEAERAARAEAERVGRMKDEFLATLSHELRTPLNAILGWAQLLQRGTLKEAELRPAIATIERNARAQTQMIEDLLDMSRIVSGKVRLDVQRVDLADVVTAALHSVEPTAAGRNVRLERILDPLAGPVSGDPARLQQVIWNLLANAIKFTPAGGKVQVVLERVNSHLELCVADTGIGIAPDFLPYVFDRFRQADASSTRQFGGLGLGLSIVRQLVELHGGTVRAKSPGEGRGATFIVALPLAVTHEHAEGRDHPRSSLSTGTVPDEIVPWLDGLTVLVVDDEPDARSLVTRILESRNARVVTAPGAADAVAAIEAARPDVLISDIGMPGVDGYELIRRVRALGADKGGNVPAIALTAFARTDDRRRALLAGFQSHVAKPTEAAELVAVVASVTGRTGAR